MNSIKKRISEGPMKKGGVNSSPTTPKPNIKPHPDKPQTEKRRKGDKNYD